MATISASMVNELRKRTGAGLMDCKGALVEANGNEEEAIAILKKKGIAKAAKKAGREAAEGIVESYIHMGGKVGVMLELNCESDFVAKNEQFKALARDICMHIAAASPIAVSREEVDPAILEKEREVAAAQAEGKPAAAVEKIVEGKINKYLEQICLLEQPFVKNTDQTIGELLTHNIQTIGENIKVRRFVRYALGE
ncbi:translation elongation factor Ts [Ruficoccus amylovorans]|uniref:Elongation factor Ts n=1 Tax=Ruficoccus amylovorans TaxID=1804625 RepID=A0A842H911_9BACT|nr:translation elongation factor Ts [Ruficoccus amylovorans]MBC2592715.1 translation elongation factor Ts [Ruficoccus amylovorans]